MMQELQPVEEPRRREECAGEEKADAAFWAAQDPWLAAAILISSWGGEAGCEALSRALGRERAGDPPAAAFWVEVFRCIRGPE